MAITHCFKLLLPVICFVACSGNQPANDEVTDTLVATATVQQSKDSFTTGKIIEHIACKGDTTQSYALYIPPAGDNVPMSIIYCFDPHADGSLPLKNYQALANEFHFILVGSNNSKNGNDWNTTQSVWNSLFNDTQTRLSFNSNQIYTCGFSGGAKVASFIALHQNNIKGVIAAGAGLPDGVQVSNFPFTFTGMAGRGDMNMTDLVVLNSELDKTSTTHRIILFDGKHAWPSAAVMHTAFAGLQLDAMRNNLISNNDSIIRAFTAAMKEDAAKAMAAKNWITAQQTCSLAINMLTGLTAATADFEKEANSITGNPQYQLQLQAAQQLFVKEQQQKQIFQQQFEQGSTEYWATTISNLITKAKASTAEGAMYQRLLAYLSLAFYSISNNLINNNQNDVAQHFVTLYKMADATNSEAWYFSALLNARGNDAKAAEADLLKAVDYGFTDTTRMLQQPEFQTLASQINFPLIESKMKKAE